MVQFGPDEKVFSPCIDLVFKSIFTRDTPESRGALTDFLESVTGRKVTEVTVHENELAVGGLHEKQSTMDLHCRFNNGDQANIEIQVQDEGNMCMRAEYNLCKLHGGQAIKGLTYENLKYTYQITIANYEVFHGAGSFFSEFEYRDREGRILEDGRTRICFLELTKLQELLKKSPETLTPPEMWALYFKFVDDPRKRGMINRLIQREDGLAMASDMLKQMSEDEHARYTLLSIEKAEMDRVSRQHHQEKKLREALETGMEKGIQKGFLEAIQMLAQNGMKPEAIAKSMGLTEAQVRAYLKE